MGFRPWPQACWGPSARGSSSTACWASVLDKRLASMALVQCAGDRRCLQQQRFLEAGLLLHKPLLRRSDHRKKWITACSRSFTISSALRDERSPWSSYAGSIGRKWSTSLESLKQLVGIAVETNNQQQKERIRIRYLELKAGPKEEIVTSDEVTFRKGMLLEIVKDGKVCCVVTDRPEGKKNWIAVDQYGNTHSVRPGKCRFIVPDVEDFKASDIVDFLKGAEALQDLSLLEIAWHELADLQEIVTTRKLATILFGDATHVECYAAHCMLSSKQVFFRRKQKGSHVFYEPRGAAEVQDLQHQYTAQDRTRLELENYIISIKSAMAQPYGSKPPPSSWLLEKYSSSRTEALRAFALDAFTNEAQKVMATEVLDALGVSKTPQAAIDVLIGMGIFPFHVNVELLKCKVPSEFSEEQLAVAELLEKEPPPDADLDNRIDLTSMKVYTIDSDTADEIDDGLSAVELPDGRVNLWIHIADPTRWIDPEHMLEKEAKKRGTTTYLPEKTIPMIPMNLAAGPMSLRHSFECSAVSISVILNDDGSIAESSIACSRIRPSLRLSYDSANELLMLQLDEERELNMLAKAAQLRYEWRKSQGAIDMSGPMADVKVKDPDSLEPHIEIHMVDMNTPSGQLVSEMMILCGEVVATYGNEKMLPLPYRGQSEFSVEMNFTRPLQHASLGLPGYVQFSSPIRRYSDLLAHYQVKAALRRESPPLSSSQLEIAVMVSNLKVKEAKKLSNVSNRYWILEYLRRKPRDEALEASVVRLKEGQVVVCLAEVGLHGSVSTNLKLEPGDTVKVLVVDAHPRKDILDLELVQVGNNAVEALDDAVAA